MEAVAYTFVILVVLLALALFVLRFQEIIYDVGVYLGYVKPDIEEASPAPRSEAFTNACDRGSSAFTSLGTVRTLDEDDEPSVQEPAYTDVDISTLIAAIERRGYLCLSRDDLEQSRKLVYQVERRARFNPASERSKSEAIERATGLKRGGSVGYQRASLLYDSLIGKPDPVAVANGNLGHQEAALTT